MYDLVIELLYLVGLVVSTTVLLFWRDLYQWLCELVGFKSGDKVGLLCPETGEKFASEHTDPVVFGRDRRGHTLATYACDECGHLHKFVWGPPAPILVDDRVDTGEVVEAQEA